MTHYPRLTAQQPSGIVLVLGMVLAVLGGNIDGSSTGSLIQNTVGIKPSWADQLSLKSSRSTLYPVAAIRPIALHLGSDQIKILNQWQAKREADQLAALDRQRLNGGAASFQGAIVSAANLQVAKDAIALTFDDGPWETTTDQVLDILAQEGVVATFFWVGQSVQNSPEVAQRVVNAGHAIGNHSWHHRYGPMDAVTAASEIEIAADIFYETTGVETSLFRPPGGYLDNGMADYALSMGYTVVMWSVAAGDTEPSNDTQAYINNVVNNVHPGSIILLHDGGGDRSQTVAALPTIIQSLKDQGYRFVTVAELLQLEADGW